MRIRSIRPEFYTSEDVAALDWDTRLLFIGLWSYVDDNGVGRDVEQLIVAHLFPLERDPRETLAKVSRGLQTLSSNGQITRYTVDGRSFLFVNAWEKHQKIDKRNKDRYELPTSTNAVVRDTLATLSRDPREIPGPGEGEKGRRGEGEVVVTSCIEASVSNARDENPPTLQDEPRSKPVNPSVMKIVRSYTSKVNPSDPTRIAAQITNALGTWELETIATAIGNLARDNRPVSADSLRIELNQVGCDKTGVQRYQDGTYVDWNTGIYRATNGNVIGGGGFRTGKPMWRE